LEKREERFLAFNQIKKLYKVKNREQLEGIETEEFTNPHDPSDKSIIAYNLCQVEEKFPEKKEKPQWF